jgi:transporter family-2 protein
MLIPAQAAMNAKMRAYVINPAYGAMVNFAVGAAALAFVILIMVLQQQPGSWRSAASAPWWSWCGGFIGVMLVVSGILVVPRTGAATFSVVLITGQLIGALIMDHFGWLGLSERPISLSRIAGIIFLLLGIWLVQRR